MHKSARWHIALVLLLMACGGPAETPVPTPAIELTRMAPGEGSFAVNSGYLVTTNLVIRDTDAWSAAWATLHEGMIPVPTAPEIDFSREMVIMIAIGEQSNGGHSVTITSVRPDGADRLLVTAVHSMAGPGCMVAQMLTAPADLARVPATLSEVDFVVDTVTADCAT